MTLEEFTKLYTENPNADEVMTEINRLYESERQLTESFATADSERNKLQKDLDEANKRYRERFFSGTPSQESQKDIDPFKNFFKEKE